MRGDGGDGRIGEPSSAPPDIWGRAQQGGESDEEEEEWDEMAWREDLKRVMAQKTAEVAMAAATAAATTTTTTTTTGAGADADASPSAGRDAGQA